MAKKSTTPSGARRSPGRDAPPDRQREAAPQEAAEPELLVDGQEEVFSHTAVERGLIRDPLAMDPQVTDRTGQARDGKGPGAG